MMKRIVIGDPHGRYGYVKNIYDKELPDEVIILGDYFDSFNIYPTDQRYSYDQIKKLRNEHLEKGLGQFIMLIGNHDMHYMSNKFGRCSGWNYETNEYANYVLVKDFHEKTLQISFIDKENKTIYTHAGLSQNWFDKYCNDLDDIDKQLYEAYQFTFKGGGDYYGSSTWNSPLWIRPEGLEKCPYKDKDGIIWNQVFGHTEPDTPIHFKVGDGDFYGMDCIYKFYLIEEIDDNCKIINRKLGDTPTI